jgi:CheY-like chemotaxis protein
MSSPEIIPKRILVVDDEADVRARMSEALEAEGWTVTACGDGSTVGATVQEFNPTVVLLDLKMPKKDGLAVLEELRKSHPWTQIVILNGHGDEDDAISCLNHDAFRYLRKPVSLSTLYQYCDDARKNVPTVLWAINLWYRALPDPGKVVFNTASGRAVSADDLINEIREQTAIGKEFVCKVLGLATELIVKRMK